MPYLANGEYKTGNERCGTEIQYETPSIFDIREETGNTVLGIDNFIYPPDEFRLWNGRWGYKSSDEGAGFSLTARNGPPGLPRRAARRQNDSAVILFTNPLDFHNLCRRTADSSLLIQ